MVFLPIYRETVLFDPGAILADLTYESSFLPFEVQVLSFHTTSVGGFPTVAECFLQQDPTFPAVNFQSFPLIRDIEKVKKKNII